MSSQYAQRRAREHGDPPRSVDAHDEDANGVAVHTQLRANAAFKARMLAQRRAAGEATAADVHAAAASGVQGSASALPHLDIIQTAFGRHDVTGVQAYVGGAAKTASEAIGAEAYATGNRVAFRESPTLHTAAHEAAHVVQQRAGVQLAGGVGAVGDRYEQHADAVADAVVRGESAEGLLDGYVGGASTSAGVQMKRRWGVARRRNSRPTRMGYALVNGDQYPVTARSVRQWKAFLSGPSSSKSGAIELVAFMARTLGHNSLPNVRDSTLRHVARPLERQALDLMEAFLSVGDIDLADKDFIDQPDPETEPRAHAAVMGTGPLMAAFNSRFAAKALVNLTRSGVAGSRERHVSNISDYAEDAADMKEHADNYEGRSTADPVQTLMASALGTAVAGVYQVHMGRGQIDDHMIHEGYALVRTGGMTIKGCLEQLNADRNAKLGTIQRAFALSAAAAGAVGKIGQKIVGAFLSVLKAVVVAVRTDDIDALRVRLIDRFDAAVNSLRIAVGMHTDRIQIAINAFQNEVGS